MKVILAQDIDRLGKTGEVIHVKDGFARNFLIPKGLAKIFTPQHLRAIENIKLIRQHVQERELQKVKEFADRLSKASCTVAVEVGPQEKLYGAVTAQDIQTALEVEGVQIDKKMILIDPPIEKLGVYYVSVTLAANVKASVKVWVVKK